MSDQNGDAKQTAEKTNASTDKTPQTNSQNSIGERTHHGKDNNALRNIHFKTGHDAMFNHSSTYTFNF